MPKLSYKSSKIPRLENKLSKATTNFQKISKVPDNFQKKIKSTRQLSRKYQKRLTTIQNFKNPNRARFYTASSLKGLKSQTINEYKKQFIQIKQMASGQVDAARPLLHLPVTRPVGLVDVICRLNGRIHRMQRRRTIVVEVMSLFWCSDATSMSCAWTRTQNRDETTVTVPPECLTNARIFRCEGSYHGKGQ